MNPILFANAHFNQQINNVLRNRKIVVRIEDQTLEMDEDGEFRCVHEGAYTEKCCLGVDCLCNGLTEVHCPDCNNEDLTERDVQDILERMT